MIREYVYLQGRPIAMFTAGKGSDLDGDGMDDDWEQQYFGVSGAAPGGDEDSDGVTNLEEFLSGGNPVNDDQDADGLPDSWEYQYFGTLAHTASSDFDGDGIADGREWALGYDPTETDRPWLPAVLLLLS